MLEVSPDVGACGRGASGWAGAGSLGASGPHFSWLPCLPPAQPLPLSWSRFRLLCHRIITHKMFDHVVLVIIFLNCITIAMERPKIDPHSAVSHQDLRQGLLRACSVPGCSWLGSQRECKVGKESREMWGLPRGSLTLTLAPVPGGASCDPPGRH